MVASPAVPVAGAKVRSAVKGAGAFPASPHANRSLSSSTCGTWKKASSDRTYDSENLGYLTVWNSEPKAELSSMRSAAVAYSRSRQASCSWRYMPSDVCSISCSSTWSCVNDPGCSVVRLLVTIPLPNPV